MSKWISVKDGFPEHLQEVIAIDKRKRMAILRFLKDNHDYLFMWPNLHFQLTDITHWMPKPLPPLLEMKDE